MLQVPNQGDFFMELEWKYIHRADKIGEGYTQLFLEDDYNLPEYKPDILKIITCSSQLVLEEHRVGNQCVWLQGKILFEACYRGEGFGSCIDTLRGEIPFQEKVNVTGVDETDPIQILSQVIDTGIVVINSRKISLRSTIELEILSKGIIEEKIPVAMPCMEQYQVKKQRRKFMELVTCKKDLLRMRQEVELPRDKPEMNHLLWKSIYLEQMTSRICEEGVEVTANAKIVLLYMEKEGEELRWYDTYVPLKGMICLDNTKELEMFYVRKLQCHPSVEVLENVEGQMRGISVDVAMDLELSGWKEEEFQVLEDAYSLTSDLKIHRKDLRQKQILLKNQGRTKITEEIALDELLEGIYLCSTEGKVLLEEATVMENGVEVKGKIQVELLYITSEEDYPIASVKQTIPFTHFLEVPGINEHASIELQGEIESLQGSLEGHHKAQIRCELQLNLIVFSCDTISVIHELEEQPMNQEEWLNTPGMIGYFVSGKEELWDVCKKFRTTQEAMMEMNQLESETLEKGQKLLIVKEVKCMEKTGCF